MQHFSRLLVLLGMALGISTSNVLAYSAIPVIEVGPNVAANTTSATLLGWQVLNSREQVRLETLLEDYGRRNLISLGGGGGGGIIDFLKLLDEVLATGFALHYQLPDLDKQMGQRFPGYYNPGRWAPNYIKVVNTSLHTLRGTLNTVHEQLKVPQQLKEDGKISGLSGMSRSARGNLAVTQAGNAINLEVVEQLRKVRQLLGATINAQNVATTHQINLHAASEKIFADWVGKSQIAVVSYGGSGGFSASSFGR